MVQKPDNWQLQSSFDRLIGAADSRRSPLQKANDIAAEKLEGFSACFDDLKKLREPAGEGRDYKALYFELIMEVAKKCPNESRHETAKRYIVERETPNNDQCASAEQERTVSC